MPMVDLIDETFIAAPPDRVAGALADRALWQRWWPELTLVVFQDRGAQGVRWTVTGELVGTSEIWLEEYADGTILHYYVRADLASGVRTRRAGGPASARAERALQRRAERYRRGHVLRHKQNVNALKDALEAGRPAGVPAWNRQAVAAAQRPVPGPVQAPSPGSRTGADLPRSDP